MVRGMIRRLWEASIWHPDAIPPDEWKYRALKRVWLPIYDLLVIFAGISAAAWGIPALDAIFTADVVDLLGIILAAVAFVCLAGVIFPQLYRVEIVGKLLLVGILASYAGGLWFLVQQGQGTREFIAVIVVLALPMPLFRLTLLGEEIKERRAQGEERT